ncbi:hypothetical protein [Desulfosporosinus sp. OT]|uniref:hypothetical protein n=1 Tax=Desulfosporosinus sp. OT TaxID=913865 RepID=UPI000223A155|nr:hypothetical protein [Desulfosporosinus sp. OT]EGW39297.1 hypothetical protein DOT_2759 [Desulfosporosinus sp. OT]
MISLAYGYYLQSENSTMLLLVASVASASTIYLSIYWGVRLGRLRLKKESKLYNFIEKKINVPTNEIVVHLILILICIVTTSFFDSNYATGNTVQKSSIDRALLVNIQKK